MAFVLYLVGMAIFIGGVAWALVVAGVPQLYIVIASVIMLGLGIMRAVSRMKSRDTAR